MLVEEEDFEIPDVQGVPKKLLPRFKLDNIVLKERSSFQLFGWFFDSNSFAFVLFWNFPNQEDIRVTSDLLVESKGQV